MVRDKPKDFVPHEHCSYLTLIEVVLIPRAKACAFEGGNHVGSVGICIVTKETKFGSKKSVYLQLVLQS